ncbi:Ig-like domain-containing protein [Parapedobacter sp. 10938]|uniref:Ig-like domain-containing protein n=1 Tax=Parapedobacter flavus TaxID=3110225 RepID=UPI002DBDE24A|nr:hypothetical protein [Parapedobacter sp. 10938]MEC3879169.1 hypothetical protein [Parapedobacter sp. 10938]
MIVSNTFRPSAIAVLLLLILHMCSCKKEPNNSPEPTVPVDPPVQVVPDTDGPQAGFISIPYTSQLDSSSYHATLGEMEVNVLNSGDTALLLAMPAGIDTGIVTLHIPGLGQFEYHIRVQAAPPVPDVDAAYVAIADHIGSVAARIGQLGADISPVGYGAFRTYQEGLSVAEKTQVVRYFRAVQQLQSSDAAAYLPGRRPGPYKWAGAGDIPHAAAMAASQPASQLTTSYATACFEFDHYAFYALLAPPESPEKLFITYASVLYGQLVSYYFGELLQRTPIIDEVFFSPAPMNLPDNPGPRPDAYPVFRAGVPFPIYASLARRPVSLADRPRGGGAPVAPLMHLLFEGYDLTATGVANVNASLAQLTTFSVSEDVPPLEHVPLPAEAPDSAYLWEPLPEHLVAENLHLQDTLGRFKLNDKMALPGMAELAVGYTGEFRAAYREVYKTALRFEFTDEFNILDYQLPLRIQAPDPESITITTVGGTPPRFTLPFGRMEFQLEATVHPAEAPQEVAWSVTSGAKLATVAQDGMVYSTFPGTKDTTGYGYSTLRARFIEDADVYADFEVKTTSYKIKHISGAGQSFLGGIPYPIQVSVQDRLDGSCLTNPIAPRRDNVEEKLQLKGFAVNAHFPNGNDFLYIIYGDDPRIEQACAVSLDLTVPRRGVDPYELPVWVYLYQDEHIIDRVAIYVHIADYKPQ